MIKEGFFTNESLNKITENYKYWKFITREALVIWWNTPTEEIIKRLIKHNREGKGDLRYFRNLIETYREYMPEKRKRTEKEIIIENYNLDEVKATKEWTEKTFKILNIRIKGDTLEEKAVQILRAQNITITMTKAHLLKEDEGKLRL
ncbi:hypothetical protein Glove_236g98 [Diversispora epigaea]|uniref:Deoxynucleoside kinase domain-containing protein n=1 Tax=Diversispora epigaea TaxID=1348612 RepID=A0A397IF63_9GLOM|nr:hypothetical protein Glove_236g98 [Diversispora epigaea]